MNNVINKTNRKKKLELRDKDSKTFDSVSSIHAKRMKYFENLQGSLPKKMKELNKLKPGSHEFKALNEDIKNITDRIEENDYLMNNSRILSLIEEDNSIKNIVEYYRINNISIPKNISSHESLHLDVSCNNCGTSEFFSEDNEGMSCTSCGLVERQLLFNKSSHLTFEESKTMHLKPKIPYDRLTYFKELLKQVQGKGRIDIPQEVIEYVKSELKKMRVNYSSQVKPKIIRDLLKKNGWSKYYENIHHIIDILTGIPPLFIPESHEILLIELVKAFFVPWDKLMSEATATAKTRKHFINYKYCLYKLCELAGFDSYKPYFPLLDDRKKIYEHDLKWKKMIEYLNSNPPLNIELEGIEWVFIKSV